LKLVGAIDEEIELSPSCLPKRDVKPEEEKTAEESPKQELGKDVETIDGSFYSGI